MNKTILIGITAVFFGFALGWIGKGFHKNINLSQITDVQERKLAQQKPMRDELLPLDELVK